MRSCCLNPCFNGIQMELRRTRRCKADTRLNPCFNGIQMEHSLADRCVVLGQVLILVIMEYKWNLVARNLQTSPSSKCLNPCFNGIQMEQVYSLASTGGF